MTSPSPGFAFRSRLVLAATAALLAFGCAERSLDPAAPDEPASVNSLRRGEREGSEDYFLGDHSGGNGYERAGVVAGQCVVELAAGITEQELNAKYRTKTLLAVEGTTFLVLSYPTWWSVWELCDRMLDAGDCSVAEPVFRTECPEANQGTLPFYEGGHDSVSVTNQDAFARIGVADALQVSRGAGVVVAVLDTGVDATHPDLVSAISPYGYDFIEGDADPSDTQDGIDQDRDGFVDEGAGHGTHVAGIVHAIAPDATILSVRVLNSDGLGTSVAVARGIRFAVAGGARVINMSFGLRSAPEIMKRAVHDAKSRGVLLVASAGNENLDEPYYFPALWYETMAIAATTLDDDKAPFSNYGTHISVSAPGVDIIAPALYHGYAYWSGTSMAAPMVAAAAALRLEVDPAIDRGTLARSIEDTSVPVQHKGFPYDGEMGEGRLDLVSLVND